MDSRWGTCGLVTKTSIKWIGDGMVHTMCLILNGHVIAKKTQGSAKEALTPERGRGFVLELGERRWSVLG